MYQPIEWWMREGYKTNIKPKIFYFSLEMSSESKILSAISYRLFTHYGIIISPQRLQSLFSSYILDEKVLNIINSKEFREWLRTFESMVTFYDNIRNPYGIFNTVKTYMEENGSWTYKTIDWQNDDGFTEQKEVKDKYTANDPNEYIIVITDHISLLQPEKGSTLHQAMGDFSSNYCLYLRDKYKACVVNFRRLWQ